MKQKPPEKFDSSLELLNYRKRIELSHFDLFAVPLIALLAAIWFFFHIGTSVQWDDLLYMNVSQHTTKQAWILNRYGHIYLQKFFFFIANDPLRGAKIFWCFLYLSSCVLIYYCAKMLTDKKGYLIGSIAVVFFCSQPLFIQHFAGCTFADLTVMFLMLVASFIYLRFFIPATSNRNIVIAILGLIFLWIVKSKENGLCMAVLFLGLGFDKQNNWQIKLFLKDIGYLLIGIFAGLAILMALDGIFLKDFFFSIRPSSIAKLLSYNTGEFIHDQKNISWFAKITSEPLSLPFFIYILMGWKYPARKLLFHEKIFWLLPISVIFFMTAIFLQIRASTTSRYLMPAIPAICIWAAQLFRFDLKDAVNFVGTKIPRFALSILILIVTFSVSAFFTSKALDLTSNAGWNSLERLYSAVILPLATAGIFISVTFLKDFRLKALAILSLCLFFAIYYPLSSNIQSLREKTVAQQSQYRYEPYRTFAGQLTFNEDVKIFISNDIYKTRRMLGRDDRSHCWLFNVFFDQKFEYDQFIAAEFNNITDANYTFAFLTFENWNKLSKNKLTAELQQKYEIKFNKNIGVVFLKKH